MLTVLVTRLMPFAGSLIKKLEENGYNVMYESLLSVEPLYCRCPEIPDSGTPIIAITSRVTLEALSKRYDEIEDFLSCTCYCVGDKTAEDAQKFGFKNVISANGNGSTLAELIQDTELFKSPVLHIGGEDISPDPQMILEAEDWKVVHWPLYKTIEMQDLSEQLIETIKNKNLDAILLHSTRASQILKKLIRKYELEDFCDNITVIGLSKQIIDELDDINFKLRISSKCPTEIELINSLMANIPTIGDQDDNAKRQRTYC